MAAAFRVPLVLGVPVIDTPAERQSGRRRLVLEWIGAIALTIIVFSAEVFVYARS